MTARVGGSPAITSAFQYSHTFLPSRVTSKACPSPTHLFYCAS